jgi:hypothetical protein
MPSRLNSLTLFFQASQLDIAKFATITGLAETSAKTAWNTLRKKALAGQDDAVAPKTPGSAGEKKKAPAKRKSTGGKKDENGEDADGNKTEATAETPSKKPRGRPAKAKATEVTADGDSEMRDGVQVPATTPAKKKPTPRKPAAKKTKASPKTPDAEAKIEVEEDAKAKTPPDSPLAGSDTANEEESVKIETSKEIVEVEASNGKTEVTVMEKDVDKEVLEEEQKVATF